MDLSAGSNGSGTSGSPWNTFGNAVSGLTTVFGGATATHPARVNVKGSQTLSGATAITLTGTLANPVWWRGYVTTIGDIEGNNALTKPAVNSSTFQITMGGAYQIFSHISFSGTFSAVTSGMVTATMTQGLIWRCRFENASAAANGRAVTLSGADSRIVGSWLKATTSATYILTLSGARSLAAGCSFEGGIAAVVATSGHVLFCTFRAVGSGAAIDAAANGLLFVGNSIYSTGGDGIKTSQPLVTMIGNLISTTGGYAINHSGTASIGLLNIANGWYAPTSAGVNGDIEDFALFAPGTAGLLAGDPFADAAGGDLSPTEHALTAGFPGEFEAASFAGTPALGAVQSASGSSPLHGGLVR